MSIVRGTELNIKNISFSEPKEDSNGKKLVFVNYNKSKFRIQTPELRTMGFKKWTNSDGRDTFEVSLDLAEDQFQKNMADLDELICKSIKENGKSWVGGRVKVNDDYIHNNYKSIIKKPYDKEGNLLPYANRMKVKVMTTNDGEKFISDKRMNTELCIFNDKKEPLDITPDNCEMMVPKNSMMTCVLDLVYISIGSLGISPVFRLIQAKVKANISVLTDYALLDDEGTNDLSKQVENVSIDKEEDNVEEEEIEEEVVEEVEEPLKKVRSKGRVVSVKA